METAIRFNQNSPASGGDSKFIRVDVIGKSFRLCKITKESRRRLQYETVHSSTKVPPFRAFDWHPTNETLVAVGQTGGEATLLNIAEGQQDSIPFSVRNQRLCNAVALNTQNLIAVGLDRVRTDFCLNIWDFNQRLPSAPNRNFSKSYAEPLHKLAGGEPIGSLKFFNNDPQLLAAAVKGQFIRLYDLREPSSSNGLQFATRSVHNLTVDSQDENYFASCYPTNEPMICIWDRRMVTRSSSGHGIFGGVMQSSRQPEPSLEFKNVSESTGTIWNMRFSKTRRGCLGVLLNSGHLKVYNIGKEFESEDYRPDVRGRDAQDSGDRHPQDIYLDDAQDVERAYFHPSSTRDENERIVSFDFMTSNTRHQQPKLIVLNGDGNLRITSLRPAPDPAIFSPTNFLHQGSSFLVTPSVKSKTTSIATAVDKIRRNAETRNSLRQAIKHTKHNKAGQNNNRLDVRRMSSFANHSWNSDLGFYEKHMALPDLLTLLSVPRLRCEAGYLLNCSKNRSIVGDSQWLEAYWSWLERAERISRNNKMISDNIDLSFIGVYGLWMEEITIGPRMVGSSSASISVAIKNLVSRLNLPERTGRRSEYPWHRKLCLHVSGLGWSHEELDNVVQKLINSNQHTKAAALAIFADEEKLAYKALRARSATQSHKMLAMAIAGARSRHGKDPKDSPSSKDSTEDESNDDWMESISSLSQDMADPYARAILTHVKSGNWEHVVNEDALPMKQRVGIALRHLSDSALTEFIGRITRQVIANGDIEGIVLTGTGTREGLELLQSYARVFGDPQTAVLGLAVGGAARRFIASSKNNSDDRSSTRKLEAFREAYRSSIMSWDSKFDRVRFDVASSRALTTNHPSHATVLPKKKEQIRLVCGHCSQSLTQSDGEGNSLDNMNTLPLGGPKMIDTAKNPLTSEKAAVLGTVCPKCGRHLPRCGVCDLWLGVPDESYAKWYGSTQRGEADKPNSPSFPTNGAGASSKSTTTPSADLGASMTASVVTTIGPSTTSNDSSNNTTSTVTKQQPTSSSRTQTPAQSRPSSLIQTTTIDIDNDDEITTTAKQRQRQRQQEREARDAKWHEVMHKFTVFCVNCSHGFHATHARMWFEGSDSNSSPDGEITNTTVGTGHRICPVPGCGCACNG